MRDLIQPFLTVEFRQESFQNCSDSCFAFETFQRHMFLKKYWQFLYWHHGVSMFFQESLKEKQSPECLYGKIADLSAWEISCEENMRLLNKITTSTFKSC